MENISYHVAAGSIDKGLLREIMEAFLNEEMDSEPLKLKRLIRYCRVLLVNVAPAEKMRDFLMVSV